MVVIKYNEEENKWLPSCHDDGGIYFDGWLLNKLDKIKWLQKNNWDVLINIVGREGSGKSTLSFIIGQYLTNMGLTLDNLASGSSDALKKLQRLPNGSLIIIDEADSNQSTFIGFIDNVMPDLYEEEENEVIANTLEKIYTNKSEPAQETSAKSDKVDNSITTELKEKENSSDDLPF